jgi:hypothetical protein
MSLVVSRQRRGKRSRECSGLFQTDKPNQTVKIKRWSDQRLRLNSNNSLISKLPKIKTNSSGVRKILRKFSRTHRDVYFLIMTSKIKLSNFKIWDLTIQPP